MSNSLSYYMKYTKGHRGGVDRIGGKPTHLPSSWPHCEDCGEEMFFVGQIYAEKPWFPLDGKFCLHLYSCGCHPGPVHLELLDHDSLLGNGRVGRPHPNQEKKDIQYEIIEDPLDRSAYWGAREHPDLLGFDLIKDYPYLYEDKIGGLFPYDAYEGPMQSKDNQMVAQMSWSGFAGSVYLYFSTTKGFYPHHYW